MTQIIAVGVNLIAKILQKKVWETVRKSATPDAFEVRSSNQSLKCNREGTISQETAR